MVKLGQEDPVTNYKDNLSQDMQDTLGERRQVLNIHYKLESQHGKTFSKISAECLEQRLPRCSGTEQQERFSTNYRSEFAEPNLRKPQLQTAAERLLDSAVKQERLINETNYKTYSSQPKSIEDIAPIDRLPVVGYQGFRAVYRHPLKKVVPPDPPQQFVHPLTQIDQEQAKTLLSTNENFRKTFEEKQPPIVGYTGFMKGLKAENMYGETYKDISTKIVHNS
ncbi:hypothetical protein pb186bvf_005693 [Paramecium bursaria]